jgi:hypothetical protein
VDRPLDEPDGAEIDAAELFQEFVMIASDEGHPGFLAVLSQQLLNEHIVIVGPIPFAAQLPAVNEIPDDVQVLAFGFSKELEKFPHLGMLRAQVNVRYPDGAILHVLGANPLRHRNLRPPARVLARPNPFRYTFLTCVTGPTRNCNTSLAVPAKKPADFLRAVRYLARRDD